MLNFCRHGDAISGLLTHRPVQWFLKWGIEGLLTYIKFYTITLKRNSNSHKMANANGTCFISRALERNSNGYTCVFGATLLGRLEFDIRHICCATSQVHLCIWFKDVCSLPLWWALEQANKQSWSLCERRKDWRCCVAPSPHEKDSNPDKISHETQRNLWGMNPTQQLRPVRALTTSWSSDLSGDYEPFLTSWNNWDCLVQGSWLGAP